jgi:phosphate acetyltransferase
MGLLERIRKKASGRNKKIVLPEGDDDRMLQAAERLVQDAICQVVLLDESESVHGRARKMGLDLSGVEILIPSSSSQAELFTEKFFEIRKHKGINRKEAGDTVTKPLYFGAMMVREGIVDGSVAGAVHTTGDVLRAGIQCIGLAEGINTVSSIFLMVVPDRDKPLTFADSAVVPEPDPDQLASIAIASAETHRRLTGDEPVVAMLSFSTYGSADHPMVDKVREGLRLAREQAPDLVIDGELQLDAAIVPAVGAKKAPESPVAGKANVLIFPDLNAGNIGYKLTQRLAHAEAIGPIIQGLRKPANDLSRGCNVDDIVNVTAICCLLAE